MNKTQIMKTLKFMSLTELVERPMVRNAALMGAGAALAGTESGRNAVKAVGHGINTLANNAAVWKASQAAHANGGQFIAADGTTVGRNIAPAVYTQPYAPPQVQTQTVAAQPPSIVQRSVQQPQSSMMQGANRVAQPQPTVQTTKPITTPSQEMQQVKREPTTRTNNESIKTAVKTDKDDNDATSTLTKIASKASDTANG